MIKILLVRTPRAYLPEVDAYLKYFNSSRGFETFDSSKLGDFYHLEEFDVVWEFKGFGGVEVKNPLLIHEYASLSTGLLAKTKDLAKSKLNPKPDLRVFLNELVRSGFHFNDPIPSCLREMGIDKGFCRKQASRKEYDFVYIGSISRARKIDALLHAFTKKNNGKLCLVGAPEDGIYRKYKNNRDIIFTGRVAYAEVPEIASKAEYGINFMPDKRPFNVQTSTKLLEYLALGLGIVTTDYPWVREFEKKHNCSFYKFHGPKLEFDADAIRAHAFMSNFCPEDFLWEKVIERSKLEFNLKRLLACNS